MQIIDVFSGFSVTNLDAAQEFYTTMLSLAVKRDKMGLHIALPAGGEVFIYQKSDHTPAAYTVLNLVVNSIDSAVDELATKNQTLQHYDNLPAPRDEKGILRGKVAGMGPDIAWITDPSGNIIALLES